MMPRTDRGAEPARAPQKIRAATAIIAATVLTAGCSIGQRTAEPAYTFPGNAAPAVQAPQPDTKPPPRTPLARIAIERTDRFATDQTAAGRIATGQSPAEARPNLASLADAADRSADDFTAITPPWFVPGVRATPGRVEAHASAAAADIPAARAAAIDAARLAIQIARTAPTEITISRIVALPVGPDATADAKWIAYAEAVSVDR